MKKVQSGCNSSVVIIWAGLVLLMSAGSQCKQCYETHTAKAVLLLYFRRGHTPACKVTDASIQKKTLGKLGQLVCNSLREEGGNLPHPDRAEITGKHRQIIGLLQVPM